MDTVHTQTSLTYMLHKAVICGEESYSKDLKLAYIHKLNL